MSKAKRKVSNWEIFWIVVTSILGLGGLFMLVLGLVGSFIPVLHSDNWIQSSESVFQGATGLSYVWFGAIVLIVVALVCCIYLNYFARRSDLDSERALRRAQRLKVINDSREASIEVESKPVENPTVTVKEEAVKAEEIKPVEETKVEVAVPAEETKAETPVEEAKPEEPKEETPAEAPAEEPKPEAPAEEAKVEEPKPEEAKPEAPVEEPKAEEPAPEAEAKPEDK